MSLTTILLTVSVACNVWFVFLLMYDRIMETRLFRFFGKLAGIWKSLHAEEKDSSPEAVMMLPLPTKPKGRRHGYRKRSSTKYSATYLLKR